MTVQMSSSFVMPEVLEFDLPSELEAAAPPEYRGLSRDSVRLMISSMGTDEIVHTRFNQIGDFLDAGDVLVINTSGTMKAALNVQREDGTPLELHLSTRLPDDTWIVEVRQPDAYKVTRPFFTAQAREVLQLPGDATVQLLRPYQRNAERQQDNTRLWIANLELPLDVQDYLEQYGFPIRYSYVQERYPIEAYQTVYATETGSAEMPSAGRAFTPELITALVASGVQVLPLILHTGVASLESHEPPYVEYYRVPEATAHTVNQARKQGRRIIAVGTTVVRALETVTDANRITHPGEGWTDIFITPERGIQSVNGMLTGLHEPEATHLAMLETLASREHLQLTYQVALTERYLWHEFGDLHLLLP